MKIALIAGASLLALAQPAAASAVYSLSGNFTGTYNGTAFTATPITFTGVSVDGPYFQAGTYVRITLASFTATSILFGGTVDLATPGGGPAYYYQQTISGPNRGFAIGADPLLTSTDRFFSFYGPFPGTTAVYVTGSYTPALATGFALDVDSSDRELTFSTFDAPAVPEPATWAMMLVGFGMVGAATRYRRRAAKVTFA